MTPRSLQRRIAAIETRRTPPAPRVVGILDNGERDTPSNIVQLAGGGERMTLDEWRRRYPHGTLIRFVYGDVDAEPE